jgi:ubiquinone/menaquinone biosynthesis C-methylase UbiE
MSPGKYQCVRCGCNAWQTTPTSWTCTACGHIYPCLNGIPRLYLENSVGHQDRRLRDSLYNGLLGQYYQYLMPFLSLPAVPARAYWTRWVLYAVALLVLAGLTSYLIAISLSPGPRHWSATQSAVAGVCAVIFYGLYRHPYLFYLLVLAVPVRVSISIREFSPFESFTDVHARIMQACRGRQGRLQLLDISTGTCNSLFRHGWMTLNADYTALDLSATMLLQGQAFMARQNIPVEFVLADAACLPFRAETFDIVLNYGAINGLSDAKQALEEMARVTKKEGLVLFLDEQLYPSASFVERLYFKKVLSAHDMIDSCPVDLMPATLTDVRVHQVYRFYYLCESYKQ